MSPKAVLTRSGVVHGLRTDQQASRNIAKNLMPICRASRTVFGYGVDAPVTCRRCLNKREPGKSQRYPRRFSKKILRGRKLGSLPLAMAPEYIELVAMLRRIEDGVQYDVYVFNDATGTSLVVKGKNTVVVWHPIHSDEGMHWVIQTGKEAVHVKRPADEPANTVAVLVKSAVEA